MKYGHFDDKAREYVIDTPRTPYPWINYLGCEQFFGIISNTAGGYCFYRDARLRRVTRGQRRPLLLHQGWRHGLEPRLEARQNGAGQLFLPPRHGLHHHHRSEERSDRQPALFCADGRERRGASGDAAQ